MAEEDQDLQEESIDITPIKKTALGSNNLNEASLRREMVSPVKRPSF